VVTASGSLDGSDFLSIRARKAMSFGEGWISPDPA
jgi:hypothetical protein